MTNRKSHTPFRLVPKSTTLDDFERPIHTLLQKRCVSWGLSQKRMKISHTISGKNIGQSPVSGDIRFMRILAKVPWDGASNDSGVVDNRNSQRFRWLILRKLYRWGPRYYIAICSPSSAFHWFQNVWPWMTLNGSFALNSVFTPVWLTPTVRLSKNNCVNTNKDRHCQRCKSSTGILVSGNVRFLRIFARVL